MKRSKRTVGAAWLWLACLLALPVGSPASPSRPAADEESEARFLSRVRRLTFEGRRAGEGYFSSDGSRIVFQSEREPGNPFFQIYVLDLTTGETRRVSPGTGKTTCAYFRPGTEEIQFASTHHDPRSRELQQAEIDFRASGKERRYDWDFDPEMDLYVARADGELVRLTSARGYDAEGSYSPDGRWIVFTSTRPAYERELSAEDSRRLEMDPSYFAEIYRARGRLGSRAIDRHPRLRRRAVFLARRRVDHLAPVRHRRSDRGRLAHASRRHRQAAGHGFRLDELGAVPAPFRGVHRVHLEQARLREFRAVPRGHRRAQAARARHAHRGIRRDPRVQPGRPTVVVDLDASRRPARSDDARGMES
jgi:hypothetical protein